MWEEVLVVDLVLRVKRKSVGGDYFIRQSYKCNMLLLYFNQVRTSVCYEMFLCVCVCVCGIQS